MITIKSEAELDSMRAAGRIVAMVLKELEKLIQPGITTKELDEFAEEYIIKNGGIPSFKGLYGYPASICTSVNDEVVHGIPGMRRLEDGDIISIDVGVCVDGLHADAARTFAVGKISNTARFLIKVTEESFFEGIKNAVAGKRVGDISNSIQRYVESRGFSVVRDLVGHGIGRKFHESPQVPNFGKAGVGIRLIKNMTLAVEPMVNEGSYKVYTDKDGWTVKTLDGKLSAHYENTIIVTEGLPEIITL
ncbi:methionine aminopeptidase type I [Caldicellulosiruptor bescii]|uniref:Methionine aminopeptidase n=2 Tax=Caldicellulosiruptor bescii TaxID=31899 RepID=B9MKG0_CALBD|nr:type I methionyl aminopeptidase [Caldicellulosiruptor bescii]ACM60818.1 methionine aminopeptidase, type I [Caldicellulosiruptor bescii DSM 6725]PBC89366.1 methionine aminopeptidase type I [Caldicellulosiruptor bescii]PBC91149.1 methionine aminopeptidase type I [Caldicellulosiruptor bescii]PBD03437.1 methionine aminopeptidase type I [Caldicellulosiruptor bescii]PBD06948.1 methionine aminopeptidase type I [Caldicellulosiruptor bescii]